MKITCAIAERGMEAVCFPDCHPQERPMHETPNAEWNPSRIHTPKNGRCIIFRAKQPGTPWEREGGELLILLIVII